MDPNCHVDAIHKAVSHEQLQAADRALLSIGGMGCQNCVTRVRNGLLLLDGVYAADVYLNLALAEVFYDARKISADILIDAVLRAGSESQHDYHALLITAE